MEGQMPPGQYPRLTLKQRWSQHGPIALNRWLWVLALICGLAAIIIYALFLSHCVNGDVAGMYLFRLSLGKEVVQVSYLGMCVDGKRPGATFNQNMDSIFEMFGTTADTDLGRLLTAGRGLQTELPMVFIFPFIVLILYALWAIGMSYLLRLSSLPRLPDSPPPVMSRVHRRLEWPVWKIMVFFLGVPAAVIAVGSSWATMTALNTVVSIWGNLGTALNDPAVAVVQKGNSIEAAQWIASVLAIIFGLHTGRFFIETRRVLNRQGLLHTNKHSTLDKERVPAMFPGTNIPMPPPVAMV